VEEFKNVDPAERVNNRINKYCKMGFWEESTI